MLSAVAYLFISISRERWEEAVLYIWLGNFKRCVTFFTCVWLLMIWGTYCGCAHFWRYSGIFSERFSPRLFPNLFSQNICKIWNTALEIQGFSMTHSRKLHNNPFLPSLEFSQISCYSPYSILLYPNLSLFPSFFNAINSFFLFSPRFVKLSWV